MRSKLHILGFLFIVPILTGCAYTESTIQYANAGTKRVHSGYAAKADKLQKLMLQ